MKRSYMTVARRVGCVCRLGSSMLAAVLAAAPIAPARADEAPPTVGGPPSSPTDDLTAWAMRWFTEMQAGRTDRSQYAASFGFATPRRISANPKGRRPST